MVRYSLIMDQLIAARAALAERYRREQEAKGVPATQAPSDKAMASKDTPKTSAPPSILDGVDVRVSYLLPHGESKAPTTFSLNALFPLKTALFQICSKAHMNAKNARLWRIGSSHDEILNLELTPSEAKVGHNEQLLVELSTDGHTWQKEDTRSIQPDETAHVGEERRPMATPSKLDGAAALRNVLQRVIQKNAQPDAPAPSHLHHQPMKTREEEEIEEAIRLSKAEAMQVEQQYERLEDSLLGHRLRISRISDDGNCLFRAVLGSADDHATVRTMVVSELADNMLKYIAFVTDEYEPYVAMMSVDGEYGTHVELQAMLGLFQRPIEIFSDETNQAPFTRLDVPDVADQGEPIRLSYHRGNHYNAVLPMDD